MNPARRYGVLALKGWAMGAANIIPGVSGGTVAFITGIYEELIHSIKSFDASAVKLLCKGDIKGLIAHINLPFLAAIFVGVAASLFSLAYLLEYLLTNYELPTMAFFFGLILASIYLVGKQVKQWSGSAIVCLLIGIAIAVGIAFLKPASENASFVYLIICGIVAACSMILPGLSGSYVLLIMGNYLLILNAVATLDISTLAPVGIGAIAGLVIFSNLLDFVFKKAHDATVALLTGFVFGSLLIIWPWKNTLTEEAILEDGEVKLIEKGYEWLAPAINVEFAAALGLIMAGGLAVILIERLGAAKPDSATA